MPLHEMSDTQSKKVKSPYCHPSTFEIVDGIVHLPQVTREILSQMKRLPVRSGDVFISSYPKSGTTWVSEIAWQVSNDGNHDDIFLGERVPFLDELPYREVIKTKQDLHDFYLKKPSPRIFKTHLQYHELPMGDLAASRPKYIHVARNPKDAAVSYYHHYKGLNFYEFGPERTWDEFFDMFINGEVNYGSWFDQVLGWWAHRDDENILFLKYEDMKKDLPHAIGEIAKFLDKTLSPEMKECIRKQTTFTAMSDGEERYYDFKAKKPYRNSDFKFIRKGKVGDWRNYFTEEQNARFEKIYKEKMSGSGLEFEF